jgi:hypothetical protein
LKLSLPSILAILEETKPKFDFWVALEKTEDKIRHLIVNESGSVGVRNWSFPSDSQITWDNPLTAIEFNGKEKFNFVFRNGDMSDAAVSD